MSVLSDFLAVHLLPALEKSFESHLPELQEELLSELSELTESIVGWVEDKMALIKSQ